MSLTAPFAGPALHKLRVSGRWDFQQSSSPETLLLQRTSFGFDPYLLDQMEQRGYEGYLDWQLDYENITEPPEVSRWLTNNGVLGKTPRQLFDAYLTNIPGSYFALSDAAAARAVFSRRQLFERMVEFWTDHFNIDATGDVQFALKPVDDEQVIRRHALGKFPELLSASAHSPAMLVYLDNVSNRVGKPQENYAREILELHTLGVDNGYTQQDVEQVAKCFTGWMIMVDPNSADFGKFYYANFFHDQTAKTVLGQSFAARGGKNDGDRVLSILGSHPNTMQYIARKLCRHFLGYTPEQSMVDQVADAYARTGGDIRAMLRVVLNRHNVARSLTPKFKRPLHYLYSMARALQPRVNSLTGFRVAGFLMNQNPFLWSTPDGYPDSLEYWGTSLQPRWMAAAAFLFDSLTGLTLDPILLNPPQGQEAEYLSQRLMPQGFSSEFVTALQDYYEAAMLTHFNRNYAVLETLGLAMASPEFNFY